jgi:polyphosphate kinase
VLAEALDERTTLLEQAKFLSHLHLGLDESFMKRAVEAFYTPPLTIRRPPRSR